MSFIVGDHVVAYPRPGVRVEGFVTRLLWGLDGATSYEVASGERLAGPFPEEIVRLGDRSS